MKKVFLKLFCLSFILLCNKTYSQVVPKGFGLEPDSIVWKCGFDEQLRDKLQSDVNLLNQFNQIENSFTYKNGNGTLNKTTVAPYQIPVVFHIISNTASPSNISYQQILWQLASLNAAFANNNQNVYGGNVGQYGNNTQISFCLAKTPAGAADWTNSGEFGVMRYTTTDANALGQIVGDATTQNALLNITHPTPAHFPFANYLNIWCVPNICGVGPCGITGAPSVIGYATFPFVNNPFDGVVMRTDAIGDNTYGCNGFTNMISQLNKGKILAHELGHYLGLFHTFQCTPFGSCTNGCHGITASSSLTDGDMIYDTPPTQYGNINVPASAGWNSCAETYAPYSLNYGNATIGVPDQVENYMSYNDDDFMNTFTVDQTSRMWGILDPSLGAATRSVLVSAANITASGINIAPSCGPGVSQVCFNTLVGPVNCSTATYTFVAPSGPDFPVNYNWNFGDGTTSTLAQPVHVFNNPNSDITITLITTNINTGISVTTTTLLPFSQNSIGISRNSNTDMCRGSEASFTIRFGGLTNQVTINKNGQLIVVNKPLNSDNFTITEMLCENTTYSLTNACNSPNTVISFSVIECGANLVSNGGFELGNIGFTSDLGLGGGQGCYQILTPSTGMGGNITGQSLFIDGISTSTQCTSLPVSADCFNCPPADFRRNDYTQGIGNLQPNTQYYIQFKTSKSHNSPVNSIQNPFNRLFLEFRLTDGVTPLLATPTLTVPSVLPNNVQSGSYEYVGYSYVITTPSIVPSTFSLQINQVQSFYHYGFDYFLDNVEIRQMNTPPLAASANPTLICLGNTSTLTSTGDWSATNFTWTPSSLTGTNVVVTPNTTTVYTVTGNDNCRSTATATITVINPTITAVASLSVICPLTQSATLTASGADSYIWNPGTITGNPITVNPTSTTIYTVTGTDVNGCINTANVTVTTTSCVTCSSCTPFGASGVVNTNPTPNNVYCINNNITITGTRLFFNSEFKIAPNVKIIVPSGANLIITKSHFYACVNMWQGIEVQPGGKLSVINNSLIEDAITAVDISNHTQTTSTPLILTINNSTFNKNYKSIFIKNYNQPITGYPFDIAGSVFTCRNIPFVQNSKNWPTTNTVKAPVTTNIGFPLSSSFIDNAIFSSTANATLKAPFLGQKSYSGCELDNVGLTQNLFTSITFYPITLGKVSAGNTNVFDNLKHGVYCNNANFNSVNNVYQNTASVAKNNAGYGIYAKTQLWGHAQINIAKVNNIGNKFIDCGTAVNVENYTFCNISENIIQSSKVINAPSSPVGNRGLNGVNYISYGFENCIINSNEIYNIENGIVYSLNNSSFFGFGVNGSRQLLVDNNTIRPHFIGSSITTQYVKNAIVLQAVLPNNPTDIYQNITIHTRGNFIDQVYRGILYTNWQNSFAMKIENNQINLTPDVFVANNLEYGIKMDNCAGHYLHTTLGVKSNFITGYGITNSNNHGIAYSTSGNLEMGCNTTDNTYNGLLFNGWNYQTKVNINTMQNNNYGFVLSNNGVVRYTPSVTQPATIGAPNEPADNVWNGTWTEGRFKTFVDNSSSQNSPMYVQNVGAFNPDLSGSSSPFSPTDEYHNSNGSLIYTSGPTPTICTTPQPLIINGNNGNNNGNNNVTLLENIVQDQLPIVSNVTETRRVQKNQVFKLLKQNNSLMSNSTVLQNFYTINQAGNNGLFNAIDQQLATNDINAAAANISSINSQDAIDDNYKIFAQSALHYQQGVFNASDSTALSELAKKCPYTNGLVVFQARALYNIANNVIETFLDNCNTANVSRLANSLQTENKQQLNIELYPNPTNDKFSIITDVADAQLTVQIIDVQGKIVFTDNVYVNNYETTIQANLTNGVYIVNIINTNNGTKTVKKLVIQK